MYSELEKVFQMVTRTSFINSLSLYFYFSQDNNETALKIRYNRCLGVSHQVSYKAVGFVTEHKKLECVTSEIVIMGSEYFHNNEPYTAVKKTNLTFIHLFHNFQMYDN